jgi:hypothetical protein
MKEWDILFWTKGFGPLILTYGLFAQFLNICDHCVTKKLPGMLHSSLVFFNQTVCNKNKKLIVYRAATTSVSRVKKTNCFITQKDGSLGCVKKIYLALSGISFDLV